MISAVILTKNEQDTIVDCIESVAFCDEVIIIDDTSTDNTRDIAKKMGATVFEHSLNQDFANQRNFGLQKARGEWVLFIDADEQVSDELQQEILTNLEDPQAKTVSGFRLKRIDTFLGRKLLYGETGNASFVRLVKKGSGRWTGKVHEVWETKGEIKDLLFPLLHTPHPTISEFIADVNFYTTLRAKELAEKGKHFSFFQLLFYPPTKFVVSYFLKRGFKDGMPGLLIASIMSFHSFLVRVKLWSYTRGYEK